MTNETSDPKATQVQAAQANIAHEEDPDPTNTEGGIPEKIARREIKRVVIKISGSNDLLEIEGDDVDLGTDLKVRYHHRLVAEFRRDAVDGWWFKSFVLNDSAPYGGEGNATDVGDLSAGVTE